MSLEAGRKSVNIYGITEKTKGLTSRILFIFDPPLPITGPQRCSGINKRKVIGGQELAGSRLLSTSRVADRS